MRPNARLAALKGLRGIRAAPDARLRVLREVVALPRVDAAARIAELEAERRALTESLEGGSDDDIFSTTI